MDRKQQLEMWFVFLVSFSLCTTAQTECSVEWAGLKIKIYTKMLDLRLVWAHSAPGTRSFLLTVASRRASKDGGQAWVTPMMLKGSLIMSLMPRAAEGGEHHMDWPGWGPGAPQRGGGGDAGDRQVLVILGWFTQSRWVSDMHTHSLYISRSVISNTQTKLIFFLLLEHFLF